MTFLNIFSNKKSKSVTPPKIIIDHREKSSLVPSQLKSLGFQLEFKQLPVADYIIRDIAIERKTISDLKSSVINKRIINQLLELKQYPKHILILEGPPSKFYNNEQLHENAFRGFLLSVALDYQVPIIFAQNEKDTARYLHILAKKPEKIYPSIRPSKTLRSKKEQLQYILEGFPNIGPTKARSLLKKFKSLKNIINATEEDLRQILGKKSTNFTKLLD